MNPLILVDIQNDFMPGGALAKPDDHDVVPVDNRHRRATGLTDFPSEPSVTGACVYSVATNYCVKCTCLDARREGGQTSIIVDACRGVELLVSCYRRSLELAVANDVRTIAFPPVSCGIYGYPLADACAIAGREVTVFVETSGAIDKIIFCCFSAGIRAAYEQVIKA